MVMFSDVQVYESGHQMVPMACARLRLGTVVRSEGAPAASAFSAPPR
jgi:hypothetical protein